MDAARRVAASDVAIARDLSETGVMLLAILVVISTSKGDIKVDLNQKKAPASVANFLKYVEDRHYDGTVFHRVIKGFMIQGGGLDEKLHEKSAAYPPVKNEHDNGLKNLTKVYSQFGYIDYVAEPQIDIVPKSDKIDLKVLQTLSATQRRYRGVLAYQVSDALSGQLQLDNEHLTTGTDFGADLKFKWEGE